MIAATFGGRVSVADPAGPEYGVISLVWGTNDQAGGGGAVPLRMALASTHTVFADHGDAIVALPRGAREWARSDKYTQIFSYGTALGVQFHPESVLTEGGYLMLGNWLEETGLQGAAERAKSLSPLMA